MHDHHNEGWIVFNLPKAVTCINPHRVKLSIALQHPLDTHYIQIVMHACQIFLNKSSTESYHTNINNNNFNQTLSKYIRIFYLRFFTSCNKLYPSNFNSILILLRPTINHTNDTETDTCYVQQDTLQFKPCSQSLSFMGTRFQEVRTGCCTTCPIKIKDPLLTSTETFTFGN